MPAGAVTVETTGGAAQAQGTSSAAHTGCSHAKGSSKPLKMVPMAVLGDFMGDKLQICIML